MRKLFINEKNELRIPWRVVALFALIFAAAFLISKGWRAAGLPGQRNSTDWQALAYASLVVGAMLGIIRYLLLWIEKRGLDAIWLPFSRSAVMPLLLGTLLGCVPIILLVGTAVLLGRGSIEPGEFVLSALANTMLPALAVVFLFSASEELVLRGYLFRQLALARGPVTAAIVTGLIFGLLHSGNPGANWQGLLFTALGGFLMGLLLIRSGTLWLLVGYHFGWNACSGNVFGLTVSGMAVDNAIWQTTLSGAEWFTGGSYGFESSVLTVACEIVVLSAALFFLHKKGGQSPFRL